MRSYRNHLRLVFVLATAVVVALAASAAWEARGTGGAASALAGPVGLNGEWAPFSRCPVDAPEMLAVDGRTATSYCVAAHSKSGSIKLGNSTATTGASDLQFGLHGPALDVSSPDGGAIVADPADVPGGLLGMMCPSADPTVTAVCALITHDSLNRVTAVVEPAGTPTNFSLSAGLGLHQPIVTLPIKVHLENQLLGSTCYIGSDADPIVLHPANTDLSHFLLQTARFDANGDVDDEGPLLVIKVSGATQGDSQFAVPAASGCGAGGALDTAINLKEGFPSAAGNNQVVLTDSASYLASFAEPAQVPNAGQQFSDDWHSAICGCLPPTPAPTSTPGIIPTITVPGLAPLGCVGDLDCDGCPDLTELGPEHVDGGQRNPLDAYDFYDVPSPALRLGYTGQARDHGIGIGTDVLAVLSYAGMNSNSADYTADRDGDGVPDGAEYDRSVSNTAGQAWRSGAPDGGIGLGTDVLAMLAQVGDTCP